MTIQSIPHFQTLDAFASVVYFLPSRDVCRLATACKSWEIAADQPGIWRQHYIEQMIPFVNGNERDLKADFKILFSRTISGKHIERFFGEFVGKIPKISLKCFNQLKKKDPFEEKKKMRDTFVFVVEPKAIRRTFGKKKLATLDEKGNLNVSKRSKEDLKSATKTTLKIPFTFVNFKKLCEHPLLGIENCPVFDTESVIFNCFTYREAEYNVCAPAPSKVNIYFMRKCIPSETRFKTIGGQKQCLEGKGFSMVSLRTRGLFNAVKILSGENCPDSADNVRVLDTINISNQTKPLAIGGFLTKKGLSIHSGDTPSSNIGAIPTLSAPVNKSERTSAQ